MSQQSEIWQAKGGSARKKCLKHGIYVTDCTLSDDCRECYKEYIEEKKHAKIPVGSPKGSRRSKRLPR